MAVHGFPVRWSVRRSRLVGAVLAATVVVAAAGVVGVRPATADVTTTIAGIPGVCAGPINPRIQVDSHGNQAAAWYCYGEEVAGLMTVQLSRSIAGGAWSTAQAVIENAKGPSRGPQLAVHEGRALVASGSWGGDVAVFVDDDGVHPAISQTVSATEPKVAANSAGDFVMVWTRQASDSPTGEVLAATGSFNAGFAPTTTLGEVSGASERASAEAANAVIDVAGNVAIGWGNRLVTATAHGSELSSWRTQTLASGNVIVPEPMIGGGQITVALGVYDGSGSTRCGAVQQPVGGSLGQLIDLGPCTSLQPVMTAMNESGLGVLVVNHEIYTEAGRDLSLKAFIVRPGSEPTAQTELGGGGVDVRQNTLASAVVDSSGVATVAWQASRESALLPMTASMDLTEPVDSVPLGARAGTANLGRTATATTLATAPTPKVAHGTWTGSGLSLAGRSPGLLAAIWSSGSVFGKANLAPTVTGLSARSAPTAGGTTIAVTGSKFVKDSVVYFGDVPAASVTYVSATQLKVVVPAQAAGQVSVRVLAQGSSAPSAPASFVYGPAPSISGLAPRLGKVVGGTDVTITGANFVPGATVTFGTTSATNVRYLSPTSLIVTAPPRAAGKAPVTVRTLAGASVTTPAAQFLYVSDDSGGMPTYSISSVSQAEGNAATTMTFTITRTGSTGVAGSVKVATAAVFGSATSGTDFTAKAPVAINFPVGATTKTVTVAIKGDLVSEPDESFQVVLSAPVNGDLAAVPHGTGQILNDDSSAPTTLSIGNVSVAEGNAYSKNVTFTVTRSGSLSGTTAVKFQTSNGTAVAPGDYTSKALTSLSFAAGQTTRTLTIAVRGDAVVEPDEFFFVVLSAVTGGAIADGSGVGTIVNDD